MRCRCWPRTRVTYKPSTSTTSPNWRQPAGIRRCWLPSSAITSPPGACSAGAGAGAPRRARQGLTSRNAAYVMCTSDSSAPCSRTSASDCGRWWISRCGHYRPHSTTRTRRSKSCTIFRPWSRCWRRGRCRTTCAATAPGSSSSGCRTPASPPTCTSDVPRSAATARVSRWCSLRCCSCSARSPRTASTRRAV
ncbi:Uncharacterised protein [Mycobacterium tuberculosis]|nr:Uncharacterised protein [Mycobacterium tuberculosis]